MWRDAETWRSGLDACRILNIKTGPRWGHERGDCHPRRCPGAGRSCLVRWHAGIWAWAECTTFIFLRSKNFRLPGDVSASKRYWKEDIVDPEVTVSPQGTIQVPNLPGTGFQIKEDFIEYLTVRKGDAGAQNEGHPLRSYRYMVGLGVLRECLLDPEVESVVNGWPRPDAPRKHEKLRELVHANLLDLSAIEGELSGHDACFFCLGVTSAGNQRARI